MEAIKGSVSQKPADIKPTTTILLVLGFAVFIILLRFIFPEVLSR